MSSDDAATASTADRFQRLVDAVDEHAIFMLDPNGLVASWNSGAQRIKGYTATEIIGQPFTRFYTSNDVASGKPEHELAMAAEHGRYREEGWRLRKDGTRFWANVVITAIRDRHGRLTGYAKVTRDETDRKAVEATVQAARVEAERANAAKDEFVSRMSHELRTPLNSILGFGRLLEMDELTLEQRTNVEYIISAGRHLLELIDEVLDISRIEHGAMRLSLEPVNLEDVIDEAIGMLRPLADRRGVSISVTPVDARVRADRQRLKQVVVNLLANAVKYNREGGQVSVDSDVLAGGRVRLTVSDTGIGIAEGDIERLFRPFERLSAEQSHVEGTGLGLVLAKQLVTAMNGVVGVTSRVGEGSSFWIEIPATDDVPDRAAHTSAAAAQRTSDEPRTVLYVEDNLPNVRLLEAVVARTPGVTLMVAMQGRLAIDLAVEHRPDLILLDLHLPDMPGEEVLRRLRADQRTAATPIVVLSADALPSRVGRLLAQGATDYMTKPFDIDELIALIDDPGTAGSARRAFDRSTRVVEPPASAVSGASAPAPSARLEDEAAVVAAFAHNMNNVLGVILNYSTLLSRRAVDAGTASDLAEIQNAVTAAVALTKGLVAHE